MAAFRRSSLYVPPLVQCRHRGKPNIERPKPGPIERRVFEAITQPIVLERLEDQSKLCTRINRLTKAEQEEHLYKQFLMKKCRQMFEENSMVVAFHALSVSYTRMRAIKNKLLHSGIYCKFFSNEIMRETIQDTKWANLATILIAKNIYVASEELQISQLVKDAKKMPELHMLGGFLEDRLLTKESLVRAAELPTIDILRGETVALLNSAACRTRSLLSSHQQTLSANLQQYVVDQTGGATSL